MADVAQDSERQAFLQWLDEWFGSLSDASLQRDVIGPAGGPDRVAVVCVDLQLGFTREGRLASPRVESLVQPAAEFLQRMEQLGVRHVLLTQDAHPEDSPEFKAYGPHCVVGSREADIVPELLTLPSASAFTVAPKAALSPSFSAEMQEWLAQRPEVTRFIVLGDCTDLCVYQTAMHLRMRADNEGRDDEVFVPAALVQTFEVTVEQARSLGIKPHPGDFMQRLFLYHLALNGVQVVSAFRD